MVRKERLELSRLAALVPKTSASTNFAISALREEGLARYAQAADFIILLTAQLRCFKPKLDESRLLAHYVAYALPQKAA